MSRKKKKHLKILYVRVNILNIHIEIKYQNFRIKISISKNIEEWCVISLFLVPHPSPIRKKSTKIKHLLGIGRLSPTATTLGGTKIHTRLQVLSLHSWID